jgi:hypothetical protein
MFKTSELFYICTKCNAYDIMYIPESMQPCYVGVNEPN